MKSLLSQMLVCLSLATALQAQSSLTPPSGPPTASMKTLQQVQPRVPLLAGQLGVSINAAGTITISLPGSYYLTANVTLTALAASGVIIASDNVTLDLNGFSIAKTTSTGGAGVFFGSSKGIRIHSGNILGTTTASGSSFTTGGFAQGIIGDGIGARVSDCLVEGVATTGIQATSGVVEGCIVDVCAGVGIQATTVLNCLVTTSGDTAIKLPASSKLGVINQSSGQCAGTGGSGIDARFGVVKDSRGLNRGSSVPVDESAGIFAKTVTNCLGTSIAGSGISAEVGSNLRGISSTGPGLYVYVLADSRGASTDGRGLWSNQVDNCVGHSSTAIGVFAWKTASFTQGVRTNGVAIEAPVATGCTSASGTNNVNQKFFGTL